eukprot:gene559-647_t
MTILVLGLLIFLGVHSVRIVADPWRTAMRARLGDNGWKGVYSLLALAGFALLIWGYGQARQAPVVLWTPPLGMRHLAALLTLIDNRSGVQVAAAEGSASKTDFGGFADLAGGRAAGGIGGYTRTPQGKVIAAAFMDAFNQMVRSLRNYKAQTVRGQGLGGGGRLGVDGGAAPSQTYVPA